MSQGNIQSVLQGMQGKINGLEMQLMRAQQSIAALQAESHLRAEGRVPRMPIEFTSQFGEDLFAWQLLGKPTNGFFIEAGAFDGHFFSVTYALEAMGWTGLLVEAIPERAAQCAKRRVASRCVHAALGSETGKCQFFIVEDQYGGMLSFSKTTKQHLDNIGSAQRTTVDVPMMTLNELLVDHQGEIDLFVLDVEGAELDVLAGLDFSRHAPRLMLVEENSRGKSSELASYMKDLPYTHCGRLVVNEVYIRNDQAEMLERMKRMGQSR